MPELTYEALFSAITSEGYLVSLYSLDADSWRCRLTCECANGYFSTAIACAHDPLAALSLAHASIHDATFTPMRDVLSLAAPEAPPINLLSTLGLGHAPTPTFSLARRFTR